MSDKLHIDTFPKQQNAKQKFEMLPPFSALSSFPHLETKWKHLRIDELQLPSVSKTFLDNTIEEMNRIYNDLQILLEGLSTKYTRYHLVLIKDGNLSLQQILAEKDDSQSEFSIGIESDLQSQTTDIERRRTISTTSSAQQLFMSPPSALISPGNDQQPQLKYEEGCFHWTPLLKISNHVYSEKLKLLYGSPTVMKVYGWICIGTMRGHVLVFDFRQNLISVLGLSNEDGSVTALSIGSDMNEIAVGHSTGNIHLWSLKTFQWMKSIQASLEFQKSKIGIVHTKQSVITSLSLTHVQPLELLSCDNQGGVGYHIVKKWMGIFSIDSFILSYPKLEEPIFSATTLRRGFYKTSFDALGLTAYLTSKRLVLMSTKPNLFTEIVIERRSESDALIGCLSWLSAFKFQSKSKKIELPLLLFSWDNNVYVYQIDYQKKSKSRLKIAKLFEWECFEPICALDWLGSDFVVLVTKNQNYLVLDRKEGFRLIERTKTNFTQLIYQDYFSSGNQSADSFQYSLMTFKGRMFLLGTNQLYLGSLMPWQQRLESILQSKGVYEAAQQALEFYQLKTNLAVVGLPLDEEKRKSILAEVIQKFLCEFVQRNQYDILLADFIPFLMDNLISIDKADSLFEEIYPLLDISMRPIFLDHLESNILLGKLKKVNPLVMNEFLDHHLQKENHETLQQCFMNIEPLSLDLHYVIKICKKNQLLDLLVWLNIAALNDYISPIFYFLRKREYKLFAYLIFIMTGKYFPSGEEMPESQRLQVQTVVYNFLFSQHEQEQYQNLLEAVLKEEGEEVEEETKRDIEYPYLKQLIVFDKKEFFKMLSVIFKDSSLNEGFFISDLHLKIDRQFILYTLLSFMENDLNLFSFIGRHYSLYVDHLAFSQELLKKFLLQLAQEHSKESHEEFQSALLQLLPVCQMSQEEQEQLLHILETSGFWRVAETIYRKFGLEEKVVYCVLKDEKRRLGWIPLIEKILENSSSRDNLKKKLIQWLPEFSSDLDLTRLPEIVQKYFPDDQSTVLAALDPLSQYRYLQGLFSEAKDNKNDHLIIYETYLERMIQFDPTKVHRALQSTPTTSFSVDKILQLCKERNLLDASVYLLEQSGQQDEALQLILDACLECFILLQEEDEEMTQRSVQFKLSGLVKMCIQLCLRSEKVLDAEQRDKMWLKVLERFIEYQKSLGHSKLFKSFTNQILSAMSTGNLSNLLELLLKIMHDPSTTEKPFSEFSDLIKQLLTAYHDEFRILKTVHRIVEKEYLQKQKETLEKHSKIVQHSFQCSICEQSLHESQQEVILLDCGHSYHSSCFQLPFCLVCYDEVDYNDSLFTPPIEKGKSKETFIEDDDQQEDTQVKRLIEAQYLFAAQTSSNTFSNKII